MSVHYINSAAEFQQLLSSNKHVVTDFWAEWCGPCKAIAPLYTKLAKDNSVDGQLAFAKVDVDARPEIAAAYRVSAMPTFMFFEDGKPAPVDTKGTVKGGGAALDAQGRLMMIRGADPRALNGAATELGKLAKAAAAAAPAEKKVEEEVAKPDDGSTVSGGYTLGTEGGKRSDWKMSLSG